MPDPDRLTALAAADVIAGAFFVSVLRLI